MSRHLRLLGDECAGVIVRKGKKVGDDDFRLGDRVMAWTPGRGAHRRVVRNPASLCHRLGDTSFEVAAALPIALTTAFYSLREVARLQKGETVLIHSAGSATGQIAVQLAQVCLLLV
jgi:NADPH:quinone reductase-like Zn-dependent oxidoreductase